jgi:ABC-type transport system involved in Fe-S cluster assembly fused permease/ATPase subunit
LLLHAVLFNIVPQLFDIVAACIFISAALQAWIAVIVFVTLGSYIPVTIILTEWRVKFRRSASIVLEPGYLCQALSVCHDALSAAHLCMSFM